jgi:hypothetical protein
MFVCCFVSLWYLVSHIKETAYTEGGWEVGAEENI